MKAAPQIHPSPAPSPASPGSAWWKNPLYQGFLLLALLALYIITKSSVVGPFVGFLLAFTIFLIVAMEVREGAQAHGWKGEVIDTLKALLLAVFIWFAMGFLLQTSSPVSAVASCSMLPNLERGDFVIVQGAQPISAYSINLTRSEFQALLSDAEVRYEGQTYRLPGSIASFCQASLEPVCQAFRRNPSAFAESRGPLTFRYTLCRFAHSGDSTPCVDRFTFDGKTYPPNLSHDVLVYSPRSTDVFSHIGDIVHRTYAVLDVEGEKYYLTKGDNNPILDFQFYDYVRYRQGNSPIPQEQVRGHVIGRIPWLGYLKLVISGQVVDDPACQRQLDYP